MLCCSVIVFLICAFLLREWVLNHRILNDSPRTNNHNNNNRTQQPSNNLERPRAVETSVDNKQENNEERERSQEKSNIVAKINKDKSFTRHLTKKK